jgi:hypothetical protein
MRVTIDGSGNILTHGDSLSGGSVIEFPVNELPGFPSGWTVTGSAPSRQLLFQGHQVAVETPAAEAERAPSTGGGLESPVTEAFAVAPITDPAPAASLTIQEVAGQGADLVLVKNATDGVIFSINSSSGVQWGDPASNTRLTFRPDGELQAKDASGNTYLAYSPAALLLALGAQQGISIKNDADSGYDFIGIAANAAPPNAFVFRGSLWFWFDDTEGAPKLMVKGKDSGDNIVTGSINLT